MDNRTNQIVERTNTVLLRLKPCEKMFFSIERLIKETIEHFFCAAKQLQPGEFLGWQMEFVPGEKPAIYAFSSADIQTERADFGWMFRSCAEVEPASPASVADPFGERRRVYELRVVSKSEDKTAQRNNIDDNSYIHDDYYYHGDDSHKTVDVLSELSDFKTILRFTAGNGCGRILIGMPDELSLRLRAMLSAAFPRAVVEEIAAVEGMGKLSALELSERFGDLLCAALYLYADEPTPIPDIADATDDEKDCTLTDIRRDSCGIPWVKSPSAF